MIIPFPTPREVYAFGVVWLAADARGRGETVANLLSES